MGVKKYEKSIILSCDVVQRHYDVINVKLSITYFTFKSSVVGVKKYKKSKNHNYLSCDVVQRHYDVIKVKITIDYFTFKSSVVGVKR